MPQSLDGKEGRWSCGGWRDAWAVDEARRAQERPGADSSEWCLVAEDHCPRRVPTANAEGYGGPEG